GDHVADEHSDFHLNASIDVRDPSFVAAKFDPDDQATQNRLSKGEMELQPKAILFPEIEMDASIRMHVAAGAGLIFGGISMPRVSLDFIVDGDGSLRKLPDAFEFEQHLTQFAFDNILIDTGSLLGAIVTP